MMATASADVHQDVQATLAPLGTSGKVIASGPKDRVFVYFSDHGAPGILGMPFGPFLYADQIHSVLRAKAHAKCVLAVLCCTAWPCKVLSAHLLTQGLL